MNRIISTLRLDVQIQWRSRFYYVSLALALLLGLGVRQLLDPQTTKTVLPMLFLLGVGGTGFIYIAGLIVFERDQHTLEAQLISPLKLTEYLNSKLISLTLLLLFEGTVMVIAAQGFSDVNWLLVIGGTILMSLLFVLAGLILIVRFSTITDFLIPTLIVMLPLQLPVLYFSGISESWVWLISPASAPTMLIWGAWNPLEPWQLLYAIVYSAVLIALAYRWALHAFTHHVILQERN